MARSPRRRILRATACVLKVRLAGLLSSMLYLHRGVDGAVKEDFGMQIFARGHQTHWSQDAWVKTWFCDCE